MKLHRHHLILILVVLVFFFSLGAAYFARKEKLVSIAPAAAPAVEKPVSVEVSVNGEVRWYKVEPGIIHVILNEGKIIDVRSMPAPKDDVECEYFAKKG